MNRWAVGLVGVVLTITPLEAQAPVDNTDLQISLVTFGPGPLPWEHFGHNALWVRQPSRGIDTLFNYGIFDSAASGFVRTFIRGRMMYIMAAQTPRAINAYANANRSVWIQELNLSAIQRRELRDFLLNNARIENRAYRYHYYFDNCSTRVRDALDLVLGGRIEAQIGSLPTGRTFRFHTQRLTVQDVPLYTGLLIGLANPVDREMSVWEEMFLPLALREWLRDVTVLDAAGNEIPLIASERTINEDPRYDGLEAPPAWLIFYLMAGLVVAAGLGWLGRPGAGRVRTVGFLGLATLWALLVGSGGLILAFLWAMTDHTTSYWNENLFFFNPLAIVLVVTLPLMVLGVTRLDAICRWVAWFVVGTGLLGLVIQMFPGFDQVNGQVIALVLPANLALAAVVLRWSEYVVDRQLLSTA